MREHRAALNPHRAVQRTGIRLRLPAASRAQQKQQAQQQPSGGDIVPGSTEDYDNRYKDFGQWSGTDWTQDESNMSNSIDFDN